VVDVVDDEGPDKLRSAVNQTVLSDAVLMGWTPGCRGEETGAITLGKSGHPFPYGFENIGHGTRLCFTNDEIR